MPRVAPPVFVVGAPRSGTSLVYRVLALHPDAAWINNYHRRVPALAALGALNRVARRTPATRARVWFGADGDNAYRYNGPRSLLDRFYPQPVEGEPLFAHHMIPEDGGATPPTPQQQRLATSLARMSAWSGGSVVISKRIGHNRRIGLLHAIDPSARFLDVTRDGRAVASSLVKVDWWPELEVWWRGDETPADWVGAGGDPAELAARHWVAETAAIDAGLAAVPAHQVHRMRYEDLVADPMPVLSAAAEFCGLDPHDSSWRAAVAAVRFPNRNAAGPAHHPYEHLMAETLRGKGYLS